MKIEYLKEKTKLLSEDEKSLLASIINHDDRNYFSASKATLKFYSINYIIEAINKALFRLNTNYKEQALSIIEKIK